MRTPKDLAPHSCKVGKWPCANFCDCPKVDFYQEPEKWIQLHSKLLKFRNGSEEIKKHIVYLTARALNMSDCPEIDFEKFKPEYKTPALEKILQRRKVA